MAAETARTPAEVNEYLERELFGLRFCELADCYQRPHDEHQPGAAVRFRARIDAGTWDGCGAVLKALRERGYTGSLSLPSPGNRMYDARFWKEVRSHGHRIPGPAGIAHHEHAPEAVARAAVAALEAEGAR